MKKFIALVLAVSVLFGTAACGKADRNARGGSRESGESSETKTESKIEELQELEGPMLEITSTIRLPVEEGTDIDNTLVLEYSGHAYEEDTGWLEGYLTDEEYLTVYNFCIESVENNTFADYYEDACDGVTYRFVFYDENGDAHLIYDGYIYENAELNSIINIFGNYYVD